MNLTTLEAYVRSFEASFTGDITLVKSFFEHVKTEEAEVEAEINHLVSLGYTVVHKALATTTDPVPEPVAAV